jgi:hypothetical protein
LVVTEVAEEEEEEVVEEEEEEVLPGVPVPGALWAGGSSGCRSSS